VFKQLFALIFWCLGAVWKANTPAFLWVYGCVGLCVGMPELPAEIKGIYRR